MMILKLKKVSLKNDYTYRSIKQELLYHSHKYLLEYLRLIYHVIVIYSECFDRFLFIFLMIYRPSVTYTSNSFTLLTLVQQWSVYFSGPFTVTCCIHNWSLWHEFAYWNDASFSGNTNTRCTLTHSLSQYVSICLLLGQNIRPIFWRSSVRISSHITSFCSTVFSSYTEVLSV